MNFSENRQGVIVPMVTPFKPDGEVDLDAAERIIQRFMESGVGAFVLGTTGETASIPREERVKLVERAIAVAQGKIPICAGIGDNCLAHSVEAGQRYLELGADAVVAHLPSYYPLNDEEMFFFFEKLHDAILGPIMLYNIPQTTSMSVPMDIVEKLSTLPRFVGFKDSERCTDRLYEAVQRFRGRADFALFMGSAVLSTEALRAGFNGLVPGSGNLVPELWQKLYEQCMASAWDAAMELQHRLDAIGQVFQASHTLGQSLAALKFLMSEMGLCGAHVLPPLRTMNGQDSLATAQLIARFKEVGCPPLQ